jgi:uncharacterized protein YegL
MSPAFDPSNFTTPKAKPLPVILLLDVSGSMGGAKIQNLNEAVKNMLETFRNTGNGEIDITVAIITFGAEVKLHQALVSASNVQWHDLSAGGGTPLGTALRMAKAMIEDKDVVPSRAYRPTVVLVSDGRPGDNWKQPLADFINEGRSAKCSRMAMAIGADADEDILGRFIENSEYSLFYAENAKQLRDFFKFVTMSVTTRTNSKDPNVTLEANGIEVKPATIDERKDKPVTSGQKPSSVKEQDEKPNEEGYW